MTYPNSYLHVHYYQAALYWLLQKQLATTCCDQWKFWETRFCFWELILETSTGDPVVLLPALTSAVRHEENGDVLKVLARYKQLARPSHSWSKLKPWPTKLVEAWKERLEKADWYGGQRITALSALVMLDRCGVVQAADSHPLLPLLLSEANAALNHYRKARYCHLAVLARWQLPPGMTLNQVDQKTLAAWVEFWEARQSGDDWLLSVIATQALLHLAEFGVPLKNSLEELLDKLAETIRQTDCDQIFWLTLWHPATCNPAFRKVAEVWLKRTTCTCWLGRKAGWQTLIDWDQRGILTQCEINLLSHLVSAAQTEKNSHVLSVLAKWSPSPVASGTTEDTASHLSTLHARWQTLTKQAFSEYRRVGWAGRINLVRAGVLPPEGGKAFLNEYFGAVKSETDVTVLTVLAVLLPSNFWDWQNDWHNEVNWSKSWDSRLKEPKEEIQQAVSLTLRITTLAQLLISFPPDVQQVDVAMILRRMRPLIHVFPTTDPTANILESELWVKIIKALWKAAFPGPEWIKALAAGNEPSLDDLHSEDLRPLVIPKRLGKSTPVFLDMPPLPLDRSK